jgi:hypothetical protein
MLAMEMCERSLQERLVECRKQGFRGIPLSELLSYMRRKDKERQWCVTHRRSPAELELARADVAQDKK